MVRREMTWSARGLVLAALAGALALLAWAITAGKAEAAFPGTNGKVAYVTWNGQAPQTTEINTANPDGTGSAQLTNNSFIDFAPTFSPDGKTIAFASDRAGADSSAIILMNADGSGQKRLTGNPNPRESTPAFSNNGKRIYFTRTYQAAGDPTPALHLVSTALDGSDERQHLPGYSVLRVVELPDGRLAWLGVQISQCAEPSPANPGCALQVRVANKDGSGMRKLTAVTPGREVISEVDSTPDGSNLVISIAQNNPLSADGYGGIASLEVDGPENLGWAGINNRLLTDDRRATVPAVAPAGNRVLFLHEQAPSLQTMAIGGGSPASWQQVPVSGNLLTGDFIGFRASWLDWGPKPKPGGDGPGDPGKPGGPGKGKPGKPAKPGDPAKCRLSWVRSRFFVFRKKPVIRLIARYKAKHGGQVRITFFERTKKNRLGRKLGKMNAKFTATTKKKRKFGFIRVRRKRAPALMKRLRSSKRGFIARLKVKNAPGYCRKLFNLDLRLSQLRFVDNQFVWFQQGTFKRGEKPKRFR